MTASENGVIMTATPRGLAGGWIRLELERHPLALAPTEVPVPSLPLQWIGPEELRGK